MAENLAHQGDAENSKILARTAVEGIKRLSPEEFYENAGTKTFLIDPIEPIRSLYLTGRFNEAVELGKFLLEIFPLYQPIYFLMSSISEQLKMFEQQIEYAEFGSYCIYGDFSGNRILAEIYEKSGLLQKSLSERKYIAESSKFPNAQDLYAYGNTAFLSENYELAIEICLRIIEDYPNHGWSCLLIGESYLLMNYANQAIPYLNRATLLMENEDKPWVLLSQAYSIINDQMLRYQTIVSAESRFPKNSSIMVEHAKYLLDNFYKEEGYEILRNVVLSPNLSADIMLSIGKLYEETGDISAAIQIYEEYKENWDGIPELDLRLGINYHNLGNFEKSIRSLDKYLSVHSENLNIWIIYLQAIESQSGDSPLFDTGASAHRNGDLWGKIYKACTNILTIDPQNLHSRIVLSEWYTVESRYEEALEIYKELPHDAALLSDAEIWRILAGSGIAELSVGNYEKAAAVLESAVNLKPSNFTALANLAEAYANSGSAEKALEIGFQYLQKFRTDPQIIHWYFGFVKKHGNDLIGASYIDRVLKSGPVSFETSINLAEMHIQNGRIDNAKSVLDSIPREDNLSVLDARLTAQVYSRLGDYESAWHLIVWAIETKKSNEYELLADAIGILIKKGAFSEAVNFLEQIIAINSENAALFTLMGDLLAASGNIDSAIEVLVKALDLPDNRTNNDDQQDIVNCFRYLSSEYLRDLGQRKNILLRLSRLYKYQGNLKISLEYANQCMDLDPGHLPTINYTVELASQLLQFDLAIELASKVKQYAGPENIDKSHENIGEYIQAVENLHSVLCEYELSVGNVEEAESILKGLNSLKCDSLRVRLLKIRLNSSKNSKERILSEFQELLKEVGSENIPQYLGNIFEGDESLYMIEDQNTWIINTAIGLSMLETAYNYAKADVLQHPRSPLSYHNLIKSCCILFSRESTTR